MVDFIVILVLLAILIPVICYIVNARKKGQKCIGCPNASKCAGACQCQEKKAQLL